MPGPIIAAKLKVSSIFTKAKCEHLLLNKITFFHYVEDWAHVVRIGLLGQSQNAISILGKE
jgi:hypothetical protein